MTTCRSECDKITIKFDFYGERSWYCGKISDVIHLSSVLRAIVYHSAFGPTMGLIYSLFGYGYTGRTDDADPVLRLTSRDKYLIKNSWATVMKDSTGNGVKFFMRLFEIEPKHVQAFPFRNIPMEYLPQNKKFLAHCNSVMYSIGSLVGVLEDPEVFISLAEKIGISHATRGLDWNALKDVRQALVDTFSGMNEEELEAWNKFLDVMLKEMYKPIAIQRGKEELKNLVPTRTIKNMLDQATQ